MDIDNSEVDLIAQFRTMNTNDKDYLIAEFKRLSNTQLTNEGCCFYLDLAEWNLNTALWTYYEYDAPIDALNNQPHMKFLCDITIGEGESVAPNTNFIKTWRIKNTGVKRWPYGCQLKLVNTNIQSNSRAGVGYDSSPSTPVNALEPDEVCDVSVELKSPEQCGIYQSQYRLFTATNAPFGDPIWLVLNVEPGGVLGITQQLNSVNMFGAGANNAAATPGFNNFSLFSSPTSPSSSLKSSIFNLNNKSPTTNTTNLQPTSLFRAESASGGGTNNGSELVSSASQSATNTNSNQPILEEEKRPDFYDDMFS